MRTRRSTARSSPTSSSTILRRCDDLTTSPMVTLAPKSPARSMASTTKPSSSRCRCFGVNIARSSTSTKRGRSKWRPRQPSADSARIAVLAKTTRELDSPTRCPTTSGARSPTGSCGTRERSKNCSFRSTWRYSPTDFAVDKFLVESPFQPSGDQPRAIATLAAGVDDGLRFQPLEGITGSGKTATIAWLVEQVQRPTLILEPNKSLAAQLASELKEMLPSNRVEFFVSYYDYYQPEAYIPRTDTFIEKDSAVNEEIDRLRHSATSSLLTHRDTIVVASVSCIYGLGSPLEYRDRMLRLEVGAVHDQRALLRRLVEMQYNRNDLVVDRGAFRLKGDTLELQPAYSTEPVRVSFFGDEIDEISFFNPVTQERRGKVDDVTLFAASHYATSSETLQRACRSIEEELGQQLNIFEKEGKLLEAQRLRSRTEHDLEMLEQTGICAGIENYSAHLDGRGRGA